ncbi:hypothetical protein A2V71_04740 [Candidatus Berkelbacteria bacterium RBG_13_40_8]|uniref:Phosphoribosyltransferase domain-containing protein n=1 Tax=Candidatus Berkelbacteria bacterium RBG_13_40_8 TaxID=1797467 RepID=A0A1F5DMM9_9BACT|nr:MAG: hypothetical protein A2V71_04740 [Candidatus Berkelbacteria bacterium RBG_13_40_8]
MKRYLNREDAGRKLAEAIREAVQIDVQNTIILGLARGGVVVAKASAEALNLPIDVLVIKKLSGPYGPEFGIGAVGKNVAVFNPNYHSRALKKQVVQKKKEIRAKIQFYHSQNPPRIPKGKTIIIVDDGLATGNTMEAAIEETRIYRPKKIIVAVPVAPKDTLRRISAQVDQIVCPFVPEAFWAVGNFYTDFSQTSDQEVKEIISKVP